MVDDEPINRLIAHNELLDLGYLATVASSGEEALAKLSNETIDLILMDRQMSGMDGIETTREIRRREPPGQRAPVIALTASLMHSNREQWSAAGLDDFLLKPFKIEDLAESVDSRLIRGKNPPPPLQARVVKDLLHSPDRADHPFGEVVESFFDGSRPHLDALKKAVYNRETARVSEAARALKDISAGIGALPLSKIYGQLDEQATQHEDLSACAQLLADAEQEGLRVKEALRSVVAEIQESATDSSSSTQG